MPSGTTTSSKPMLRTLGSLPVLMVMSTDGLTTVVSLLTSPFFGPVAALSLDRARSTDPQADHDRSFITSLSKSSTSIGSRDLDAMRDSKRQISKDARSEPSSIEMVLGNVDCPEASFVTGHQGHLNTRRTLCRPRR